MHPVYAVATPQDVGLGAAYFEELARLAPQHGFGFGRKLGVRQIVVVPAPPSSCARVKSQSSEWFSSAMKPSSVAAV